jgi:hypothetical protein
MENLIQTASELPLVPTRFAEEYGQKREIISAEVNRRMLEREDIHELVGAKNLEMMENNHANHLRFMESIFKQFHAKVLVETILWVFRAYRSRNFHVNYWVAELNVFVEVLKKQLSPEAFDAIYPMYHWMIINIPSFTRISDEQLKEIDTKM